MSSGAATALSPSEQARLRREKREKRILAQGSSRLEKIAGLQGGATAREALHPDPPEADIADLESSENKSSHGSDVVREVAPAPSSPRRTVFSVDGGDEDPFNMLRRGNDPLANVPEELRDDPMLRLLLKNHLFHPGMQSDMGAAPERESSAEDLTRLAEKITRQLKRGIAGGQEPQTQQSAGPDPSALKWKFARTISIITILGYLWTQLEDFHFSRNVDVSYRWPIFYTFIALSLSLQALRLILDKGRPLPGSMIATVGSMLPHPFGTALVGFARYRMILTDLLEDFAALVVGLAIMYWIKTT